MKTDETWRDIYPTNYLTRDYLIGSEDLAVTIKSAGREEVKDPTSGRKSDLLVAHFDEDIPPMIINPTNAKRIQLITGTNRHPKWAGARILIYFDSKVKRGNETVGGLRVRNYPPKETEQEPAANLVSCSICHQYITHSDPKIQAATVAKSIEEFGAPVCISCWNKKKAGAV